MDLAAVCDSFWSADYEFRPAVIIRKMMVMKEKALWPVEIWRRLVELLKRFNSIFLHWCFILRKSSHGRTNRQGAITSFVLLKSYFF